tara:strand:+ start:845 stop:1213 length:369 start_codon:yes stop_codon:yes gene_type:complete
MILIFTLLASSTLFAGPVVEIYECELNEGKSYDDLSSMMDTFSGYLEKAGLEDTYTAHVGFQQIPVKAGSVNWIGISPSAEDFGKAIEWFTSSEDGRTFGALYESVYSCENSFMTYITASSK